MKLAKHKKANWLIYICRD